MTESVLRRDDGAVVTITINRPEARNALTTQTKVALLQALRDCGADENVRAVVLTGAGQAFCAGRTCASMPTCPSRCCASWC